MQDERHGYAPSCAERGRYGRLPVRLAVSPRGAEERDLCVSLISGGCLPEVPDVPNPHEQLLTSLSCVCFELTAAHTNVLQHTSIRYSFGDQASLIWKGFISEDKSC